LIGPKGWCRELRACSRCPGRHRFHVEVRQRHRPSCETTAIRCGSRSARPYRSCRPPCCWAGLRPAASCRATSTKRRSCCEGQGAGPSLRVVWPPGGMLGYARAWRPAHHLIFRILSTCLLAIATMSMPLLLLCACAAAAGHMVARRAFRVVRPAVVGHDRP